MAEAKKENKNIDSKGYRRNYVKGVAGWQKELKPLRTMNNAQIALRLLGIKSPIADKQTPAEVKRITVLSMAKYGQVRIPRGLLGRIKTVDDLKPEKQDTSEFKKAIAKAIAQLNYADKELTIELKKAIKASIAKCSKLTKTLRQFV